MSSALDKCPYCFSNIPKHLIVAIGMKVRTVLLCHVVFVTCVFDLSFLLLIIHTVNYSLDFESLVLIFTYDVFCFRNYSLEVHSFQLFLFLS